MCAAHGRLARAPHVGASHTAPARPPSHGRRTSAPRTAGPAPRAVSFRTLWSCIVCDSTSRARNACASPCFAPPAHAAHFTRASPTPATPPAPHPPRPLHPHRSLRPRLACRPRHSPPRSMPCPAPARDPCRARPRPRRAHASRRRPCFAYASSSIASRNTFPGGRERGGRHDPAGRNTTRRGGTTHGGAEQRTAGRNNAWRGRARQPHTAPRSRARQPHTGTTRPGRTPHGRAEPALGRARRGMAGQVWMAGARVVGRQAQAAAESEGITPHMSYMQAAIVI